VEKMLSSKLYKHWEKASYLCVVLEDCFATLVVSRVEIIVNGIFSKTTNVV
jgi:hypothetical protein